ncbi:hypothetical protein [Acidipropionibacterium timonense]|uniref:hypothetical protein n=1 Tax=Acidipropionibacterium timonense TaxID=2161818 RepID=UPI0010313520|nr:hypothetical protein [Acidipropionibacterium timonense]
MSLTRSERLALDYVVDRLDNAQLEVDTLMDILHRVDRTREIEIIGRRATLVDNRLTQARRWAALLRPEGDR